MTCEFGPEEMTSLEKLLRAMLTYEPSKRVTIRAALGSDWMNRWGHKARNQVESSM